MTLKHWIWPKDHFKTLFFLQLLGGGTLLSLDPGPNGVCVWGGWGIPLFLNPSL